MRTIEFRGVAKENGRKVFGSLLIDKNRYYIGNYCNKLQYGTKVIIKEDMSKLKKKFESFGFIEVIPESVSEFTGKLDMNKCKIYENDVLENGEDKFKVYFDEDQACFCGLLDDDICISLEDLVDTSEIIE